MAKKAFIRYLLLEWKTKIINSFFRLNGYRISNGNLERKNSDIKTIIKVSNDYTNFYIKIFNNHIQFFLGYDYTIGTFYPDLIGTIYFDTINWQLIKILVKRESHA